jgi:undecaprenyl diphosphate synthase
MDNSNNNIQKIPTHVGLILDGNRRWAKERNLSGFDGHLSGYKKMIQAPKWFFSRGVKFLSIFAFSTENWNRKPEEVNYLMKLLKETIDTEVATAMEEGYRILISGRLEELPGDLPDACRDAMSKTAGNKNATLNICLNYGGRAEIVDAIKKIIHHSLLEEQVHEGIIKKYTYQPEVPDLDVLVRTSGEHRTSGFLLWQAAYAELIFLKKYWPDFEEGDADLIIAEYDSRERRYGK